MKSTKQCNPFKITDVKNIFSGFINEKYHLEVLKIKEEFENYFKVHEGASDLRRFNEVEYNEKLHRELRGSARSLRTSLEKLENPTEEVVNLILKNYNKETDNDSSLSQRSAVLRNFLTARLQDIESKLELHKKASNQRKELFEEYQKVKCEFFKNFKKKYNEDKKTISLRYETTLKDLRALALKTKGDEKKRLQNEIKLLENSINEEISSLSVYHNLRNKLDNIKPHMYRVSKSDEIFSYLLEQQTDTILNAIEKEYQLRKARVYETETRANISKLNLKPNLEDLLVANVSRSPFSIFFVNTEAFKNLTNVEYNEKAKTLFQAVTKIASLNKKEVKYDPGLLQKISMVLYESFELLSRVLLAQLDASGIHTFKTDTFHLVLNPVLTYSGFDYEPLRLKINNLWLPKNKRLDNV